MQGTEGQFVVEIKFGGKLYPVAESRLQFLQIFDNVEMLGPSAELVIEDRTNFLTEILAFSGQEDVEIRWGRTRDDICTHTFKVFNSRGIVKVNSTLYEMNLLSKSALSLLVPAKFKSYPMMKVSEVVEEIADELALDAEVEDTDQEFNWFCPGWSYGAFVRWLATKSRSLRNRVAGYLSFVDLDDKLNFFSLDYAMVREEPIVNITPLISESEKDAEMYGMRITHCPGNTLPVGGLGATKGYYNWEMGEFTSIGKTLEDTVHKGLTEAVGIHSSDLDRESVFSNFGTIHSESELHLVENPLESMLILSAEALMRAEVVTAGDHRYRPGKRVRLTVPSAFPSVAKAAILSGDWIIQRVTHRIVPDYAVLLTLMRSGVSGSEDADLLTPPGGRAK